jgi:hypothetical protein
MLCGKWFPTFLKVLVVLSYSRVELLSLKDEGTTMLKNGWESFIQQLSTASQKTESSTNLL